MNAMQMLAQSVAMNAASINVLAGERATPENLQALADIARILRSCADQLDQIAAAGSSARGPMN